MGYTHMCVCMHVYTQRLTYFKEMTHMTIGTSKSEIYREGYQAENSGKD